MRHFSYAPSSKTARKRLFIAALIAVSFFGVHPASNQAVETPTPTPTLCNQPASEYKTRRNKLLEQVNDGVVILQGNVEESLGVNEKFRQNENFLYLTGVETPGALLALTPFGYQGKRSLLFLPKRNPQAERWTGPQIGPDDDEGKMFGFDAILPTSEFQRVLREMNTEEFAKQERKVYLAEPLSVATARNRDFAEKLQQAFPKVTFSDARTAIYEMRKVKSQPEIALLQKAIDITGEAQRDVVKTLAPGKHEYEMEALILAAFFRNGAERVGFPCIVGSGVNATTLHYNRNKKRIENGDLVVVDIGAEYSGYTADITRTYPANGKFTTRQREIYQLVLDAQESAAKSFIPGKTTMNDLNLVVRDFFRASKLRAGNNLTMDTFFLHGLGHYIGLYVHDVGGYAGPLPVGGVITIEPGLYLPQEKIGVRIEDDYLITEKGLVKLSKEIPSAPDDIERLMSQTIRQPS